MSPGISKGWTAIGFPWGSWAAKEETKPGQQMCLLWSQGSKWSQISLSRETSGQLREREGNLHVLSSNGYVPDWAANSHDIIESSRKPAEVEGIFPTLQIRKQIQWRELASPRLYQQESTRQLDSMPMFVPWSPLTNDCGKTKGKAGL